MSATTSVPTAPEARAPEAETSGRRPGQPPLWAVELLDVLGRRGGFAIWVAAFLSALTLLVATLSPRLIPARALVGAVVAVTALAVALALALALDALDVRVRGPRHVRSSGGELVALLPDLPAPADADDLARAVLEVAIPGSALHLGLAPIGADLTSAVGWSEALARALARTGASVLHVDLASAERPDPGILEVVRDRMPLADVVMYVDDLPLATVGPGPDRQGALQALISLPTVVPGDVDVLIVMLPPIVTRSAVNASRVLDQVLLVAEANLTPRVELMASLDALRVAGCAPQVVLVDGATYSLLRPGTPGPDRERTNVRIPTIPLEGGPAAVPAVPAVTPPAVAVPPVPVPAVAVPRADAAAGPTEPQSDPLRDTDELSELEEPETEPELDREPEPEPEPEPEIVPQPVASSAGGTTSAASADEVSSHLRTVDVLEAAAAARAESVLEATQVDTVPMTREEVAAELASPTVVVRPRPVDPPPPVPASVPAAAAHEDAGERTTELHVETGRLPDWADIAEEEDLLRTTVQLSVFADELDLRDEH